MHALTVLALACLALLLSSGCIAAGHDAKAPEAPAAMPQGAPMADSGESYGVTMSASPGDRAEAPAEEVSDAPPPAVLGGAEQAPVAQPAEQVAVPQKPMLDIEANVSIEVDDVERSADELRKRVLARGGQILNESLADRGGAPRASFTLRVPSESAYDLLAALGDLGVVRSREVAARDIGKQYFDAALRLQSLEVAYRRYQEILAQARNVDEIMRVEREIDRLRSQIEQVKGDLRFMRDRAARATVHVSLFSQGEYVAPVVHPEAKLYPGLRLSYAGDFRGDDGRADYLGPGISLRFSRHFSLDLEGFRAAGSDTRGLDALFITIGGELYSEFFQDGNREWLNPYLGFRGGYAHIGGGHEAMAGGTVGLEIYKTKHVTIDAECRVYAVFGSGDGVHAVAQPGLGVNVAF